MICFFGKHKIKIPYVVTLHGSYEACGLDDKIIKSLARKVDKWIFTADKNLDKLSCLECSRLDSVKMANAMPYDNDSFPLSREELNINADTVVFTLVARGIKRKGWRASIQAFLKLLDINDNVHLLLCGDGDDIKSYKDNYENHEKITFLGYQSKINGLYRLSDCAIVPTRFEGESYPLCIIQAFQEGVPVIGTDIGEIKSMLTYDNYDSGTTVNTAGIILPNLRNTKDFIEALADAMKEMLDPGIRNFYKEIAFNLSKKYSMNALSQEYTKIFQCIISEKKQKRIFIHIGIGKTGTSSIQKMLIKNYDKFLDQNVLIPKTGLKYGMAHHDLADLNETCMSEEKKKLYLDLLNEIEVTNEENVILSSEFFSYVSPDYVEEIKMLLNEYDVKIVFYVRDQIKLFNSTYLQWLKVGNKDLGSPEKFYNGHKDAWDFNVVIKAWEESFGQDKILAKVFDKRVNDGDVCKDFMKTIGLENLDLTYPEVYDNESLIPDFKELVMMIDDLAPSETQRKEIIQELVKLSVRFKSLSSRNVVDSETFYDDLKRYFYKSNKLFSEKYLAGLERELLLDI